MHSLFLSPHSDDEALFGSFTILKHQPLVVICFESSGDYGDSQVRLQESIDACLFLGVPCQHLQYLEPFSIGDSGLWEALRALDEEHKPEVVWAPSLICSHDDHRRLALGAVRVFGSRVRRYDTYSMGENGVPRKERSLRDAPIDDPRWVTAKYMALQCYQTQINHPRANQFFLWDLLEYAEQP